MNMQNLMAQAQRMQRDIMKKKEEAISMARTANVFARVEPEVKEQAEQVLDRLGIQSPGLGNRLGLCSMGC